MSPLLLLNMNKFSLLNDKKFCVGGRHMSNTNNYIENEKVNPKTKNIVKTIRGKCSISGRNTSQIFTK